MNYEQPELRRMLAAEYALGTLDGAARRRFEALLRQDAALRQELVFWETRLAQLGLDLSPVQPPARVWAALRARIGKPLPRAPGDRVNWWDRINLWRAAFAVSSAVAVGLVVVLMLIPAPRRPAAGPYAATTAATRPASHEMMALIRNKQQAPMWLFTANMRSGTMSLRVMQNYPVPQGKGLELWMLPAHKGAQPVPMGMIPSSGVYTGSMPASMMHTLKHAPGLAVSVEPAGGSPTGEPTGPILFKAPLFTPRSA